MTCYVCPVCTYRWKVIPDGIDRDTAEVCPNCAPKPTNQLWEQTFSDVCPPEKP